MKNLLAVLVIVIATFSVQASAATLSWLGVSSSQVNIAQGIRDEGATTTGGLWGNASYQMRTASPFLGQSFVQDYWYFHADTDGQYKVAISTSTGDASWLRSIWSGGDQFFLGNNFIQNGNVWTATFNLLDNLYTFIAIEGQNGTGLTDKGLDHTYAISIERVAETPIPAAFWLFGSALAGMMGLKNRKSA
jgi:hypothetical protein